MGGGRRRIGREGGGGRKGGRKGEEEESRMLHTMLATMTSGHTLYAGQFSFPPAQLFWYRTQYLGG